MQLVDSIQILYSLYDGFFFVFFLNWNTMESRFFIYFLFYKYIYVVPQGYQPGALFILCLYTVCVTVKIQ